MDKYYTPTVDEFYVGFEYEKLELRVQYDSEWRFKVKKTEFYTKQWTNVSANYNWEKDLEEGLYRVKYLDKKDIESLGFEMDTTSYGVYYFKDNIEICTAYDGRYEISKINKPKEGSSLTFTTGTIIFLGDIKNKSELKKLLKQLKISE